MPDVNEGHHPRKSSISIMSPIKEKKTNIVEDKDEVSSSDHSDDHFISLVSDPQESTANVTESPIHMEIPPSDDTVVESTKV